MTTEDTPAEHRFMAVIVELYDNFMARGWEGPYYALPDDSGVWEVCMVKSGEPDSRRPMRIVKVYARVHITADEAKVMKVEELAHRLTIAVAGRAAHEALEWCWLRRETFIDPHNADVIAAAAKSIEYSLVKPAPARRLRVERGPRAKGNPRPTLKPHCRQRKMLSAPMVRPPSATTHSD